MSTMEKAINDVAEVMQFENWLRFYFIRDEEGKLFIRIPEQAQKKLREEYPGYWGLVERLLDKEITYELSISTVCTFVVQTMDGSRYRSGMISEVFDDNRFQEEMQLFGIWSQHHEAQLEQSFMDFNKWQELYSGWKNSEEVQDFLKKARAATPQSQGNTVQ